MVPTGLFLVVPEGFECQVRPRSGLAWQRKITVFNSPGTIDSDYRGELAIMLENRSAVPAIINVGDRIAQLVFSPVIRALFSTVEELSETARGSGGWGSTGS